VREKKAFRRTMSRSPARLRISVERSSCVWVLLVHTHKITKMTTDDGLGEESPNNPSSGNRFNEIEQEEDMIALDSQVQAMAHCHWDGFTPVLQKTRLEGALFPMQLLAQIAE